MHTFFSRLSQLGLTSQKECGQVNKKIWHILIHTQCGDSPKGSAPPHACCGASSFVYAIITQNLLVATVGIFSPLAIITIGYGLQKPRFIYLMYATYAFFFTTVSRYIRQEKLSVGLDILFSLHIYCHPVRQLL